MYVLIWQLYVFQVVVVPAEVHLHTEPLQLTQKADDMAAPSAAESAFSSVSVGWCFDTTDMHRFVCEWRLGLRQIAQLHISF